MSAPVAEIASTLQSLSINWHPDPDYDINPSTAASTRQPVHLSSSAALAAELDDATNNSIDDAENVVGKEVGPNGHEIPVSVLQPARRNKNLPPLPDLRFEQSYLASIRGPAEQGRYWRVGWITIRDQVFLPLLQGTLWSLLLTGWRHWNKSAQFSGSTAGARLRRWWWDVNNWKIPNLPNVSNTKLDLSNPKVAEDVEEVSRAAWPI